MMSFSDLCLQHCKKMDVHLATLFLALPCTVAGLMVFVLCHRLLCSRPHKTKTQKRKQSTISQCHLCKVTEHLQHESNCTTTSAVYLSEETNTPHRCYVEVTETSTLDSSYDEATETSTLHTSYDEIAETSTLHTSYDEAIETSTLHTSYDDIMETSTLHTSYDEIAETSTLHTSYDEAIETSTLHTSYDDVTETSALHMSYDEDTESVYDNVQSVTEGALDAQNEAGAFARDQCNTNSTMTSHDGGYAGVQTSVECMPHCDELTEHIYEEIPLCVQQGASGIQDEAQGFSGECSSNTFSDAACASTQKSCDEVMDIWSKIDALLELMQSTDTSPSAHSDQQTRVQNLPSSDEVTEPIYDEPFASAVVPDVQMLQNEAYGISDTLENTSSAVTPRTMTSGLPMCTQHLLGEESVHDESSIPVAVSDVPITWNVAYSLSDTLHNTTTIATSQNAAHDTVQESQHRS